MSAEVQGSVVWLTDVIRCGNSLARPAPRGAAGPGKPGSTRPKSRGRPGRRDLRLSGERSPDKRRLSPGTPAASWPGASDQPLAEDTGQARWLSSRLETRTKEFDMYASVRA